MEWHEFAQRSQAQLVDILDIAPTSRDDIFVGGDVLPETLIAGYAHGIFPMFVPEYRRFRKPKKKVLAWFCPRERGIMPMDVEVHLPKAVKRYGHLYDVRFNTRFRDVVLGCHAQDRGEDSWLYDPMIESFCSLFDMGFAQSVEIFKDDELVAGGFGIGFGKFFSCETMFHNVSNGSRIALYHLKVKLREEGVELFDLQWLNEFTKSNGAISMSRDEYGKMLKKTLASSTSHPVS